VSKPRLKGTSHNWETERSLLGALLLDPEALGDVTDSIVAEDFSKPQHQALYRVLLDLDARKLGRDVVGVLDELERQGGLAKLNECGGPAYIVTLPQSCATVDNAHRYASRVADHAVRRRLDLAATTIHEDIADGSRSTEEILHAADEAIATVGIALRSDAPLASMGDLVRDRLRVFEARANEPREVVGVPSGIHALDLYTRGFQPGRQYIVAAPPKVGKTSLMINTMLAAAGGSRGVPPVGVSVHSLEMSPQQLTEVLIANLARVNSERLATGQQDDDEWRRIGDAAERLSEMPIWIDGRRQATAAHIRARCRRHLRANAGGRTPLGLVMVDYLGLMGAPHAKADQFETIAHNSAAGANLALEISVPLLMLAQINNRKLMERADKRPNTADIRGGMDIEANAACVILMYRDDVYHKDSANPGITEFNVAANRFGRTGIARAAWTGEFQLFSNLAADYQPNPAKAPAERKPRKRAPKAPPDHTTQDD
jgi:replicative DNA helicase